MGRNDVLRAVVIGALAWSVLSVAGCRTASDVPAAPESGGDGGEVVARGGPSSATGEEGSAGADEADMTETGAMGDQESGSSASPGGSDPATLETAEAPGRAVRLVPIVLEEYPHDPGAFTQGLLMRDGLLYESTGLNGRSSLRRVDKASGDVLQKIDVDERYFAEGLTLVDDRLIQLTWKAGEAFVYDAETFDSIGGFTYDGEGWGLCHDGERLVMSDGGTTLEFRDPETFEPIGEVEVTLDGAALKNLNELECVGDRVWANVWLTDMIVEIDPASGAVTTVVDAARLKAAAASESPGIDVLNGIAFDPDTGRFLLTGKLWPTIFEVDFVAAGGTG